MERSESEKLLLHILRVSLISIRNLAANVLSDEKKSRLEEWSIFVHTLPAIIMGECDPRSIARFLNGGAKQFLSSYPSKDDPDFLQVSGFIGELRAALE